jgi:hypothetical protein
MQQPAGDQTAAALQQLINVVSQHSYSFFTAIAAVGVLSMAVIQTMKDMFPLRNWFQQVALEDWLRQKASQSRRQWDDWLRKDGQQWFADETVRGTTWLRPTDAEELSNGPDPERAEQDLIKLATDGDSKALYDLPIEQLCGQLNAAAQVVLDQPREHPDLMRSIASVADPADIARVMFPPREANGPRPPEPGDAQRRYDSFIDARNRVTHQIQRAIDALQVSAGFRWKFYLQLASIVLSGIIAAIGVWTFGNIPGFWQRLLTTLAVGVLGGFLAPVARDLVAALQQLRK